MTALQRIADVRALPAFFRALRSDRSGMAMVEFALSLPFVVPVMMTGAELTNFTTAKMRISQLALQVADNGARMGTGSVISNKTISEAQINDLLTGAGMQAGNLDFYPNGRIIMSSLEPDPDNSNKYRIRWQRCRGDKSWTSHYGNAGDTNLDGVTMKGQNLQAPSNGAIIFVEVAYDYQPIISDAFLLGSRQIVDTAAMTVRDARDYTGGTNGIYNAEAVTASTCS